ncbi:hypothetical protein QVD17_41323 [Tagetes erecta]|uniref:Bromodomain associated domain-containing protein n=1 Tax=Tagetes erecta TaxID=13708 RepID=A0AAD8JT22_TARER|nr:hypothetical protein QVD17_41323 [Tagetes erecta]
MMKKKLKKKILNSSSSQTINLQSSDLHFNVVKIAVAQICNSIGYKRTQTSALETLTSVTIRYLQSLATSAVTSANSTGRTECNLFDIIRGLEDLHSGVGFHGNSNLNRRLYKLSESSIVRDTMEFVHLSREIPFAKPLPRYIVTANPPWLVNESGKLNHIPIWLPDFPKIVNGGEKTVVEAPIEDESAWEKRFKKIESNRRISNLPEKRKKVSFPIIGGDGRNVIVMECEGDLRGGICKGGKRVSCQIYEDVDESFVNASCSSNHDPKLKPKASVKMKLQEQT